MNGTQRLRALLALAFLLGTAWVLHAHGSLEGELSVPLRSTEQLAAWAEAATPPTMAAAALRLAALGASIYCAGAIALVLVADLSRCGGVVGVALAASPRVLRRMVAGHAMTVGLAAGAVLGPAIRLSPAGAAPAAIVDEPEATMGQVDQPPGVATMVLLDPGDVPPPATETSPTPPPSLAPVGEPVEWLVASGDSFWSIAETNAAPDDVPRYWQDLITTNRDRLVAPDCPDLLIPGQTLVLPGPRGLGGGPMLNR